MFRTQAQLDAMAKDIAVLKECGVPFKVMNRAEIVATEPALARVQDKLVGALQLPMTKPAIASCSPKSWPAWLPAWACSSAGTPRLTLLSDGDRIAGVRCGSDT